MELAIESEVLVDTGPAVLAVGLDIDELDGYGYGYGYGVKVEFEPEVASEYGFGLGFEVEIEVDEFVFDMLKGTVTPVSVYEASGN